MEKIFLAIEEQLKIDNGELIIVVFPSGMDLNLVGKGFILSAPIFQKTLERKT